MSRAIFTPRARADLDDIWEYTARRWGLDQAERYLRRIAEAAESIAEAPGRGRTCDHVREGYRKYPVGSHVLFYREMSDGVDVVRILHQQMDFDRDLP
jgi:toxin ParE1/3/4